MVAPLVLVAMALAIARRNPVAVFDSVLVDCRIGP